MAYRCEAASVEGFIQYLACNLVNKGYWFYVTGSIPERKSVQTVDRKLVELYGLNLSKWARARRKAQGKANVAYLRYERFFILLATQGAHPLFEREGHVRDIRRQPIQFHGYSIGCSKGGDGRYHASVKIHADAYRLLESSLLAAAVHRSKDYIEHQLRAIQFVPYARVRRQLLKCVKTINVARQTAGFDPVSHSVLNLRRQIVRVFTEDGTDGSEDGSFPGTAISNIVDGKEFVVK